MFEWIGTNGVAVQGKTGAAMMDGRDGEAMMAAHGVAADNGVRLPKDNLVSHNLFVNYGIWDKQAACFHKALAPGNMFLNNVCFNSSRHGVNFQDGMGGGGVAEGNLMFNNNRETSDTTAFNSWVLISNIVSSILWRVLRAVLSDHVCNRRRIGATTSRQTRVTLPMASSSRPR